MKSPYFSIKAFILFAIYFAMGNVFITPISAQKTYLLGMTREGGANNLGAIIRFDPAIRRDSVLWSFGNGKDGQNPEANFTYDPANGLFYGMTTTGGDDSLGAIISFDPVTYSEHVVWSFGQGKDGCRPVGSLVYDSASALFYGTTVSGGSFSQGVLFSFDPTVNQETIVHNFGNTTADAAQCEGDITFDPVNGSYYGMATEGGTTEWAGAIYSFNPAGNTETVLYSFAGGHDGNHPQGNLVYNPNNGLFYGLTSSGGIYGNTFYGTIISFDAVTNTDSVLWSFGHGNDGAYPSGSFIYDTVTGSYYATTYSGGSYDNGSIISFDPVTNMENVVWNFGKPGDGVYPSGNLVYDPATGLYYGMTGQGELGIIYSFDAVSDTEKVVWSFGGGKDGSDPYGSLVLYSVPGVATAVANSSVSSLKIYPDPTGGTFNITGLTGGETIEIYNCLGQEISTFFTSDFSKQVNISSYADGIYFVTITGTGGVLTGQYKVIKSN